MHRTPRLEGSCLHARNAPGNQAFGVISTRQVEVSEDAAELARNEQPADRLAERIQDAPVLVVRHAPLRVRNGWPEPRWRECGFEDGHHTARWTAEFTIDARRTGCVPRCN